MAESRWDSRRGILQCFPHLRHLRITHPDSRPFGIPPPTAPRALRPPGHRDPRAKGVILTFVMVTKSHRTDPFAGNRSTPTHTRHSLRRGRCAIKPGVTPGMGGDDPTNHKVVVPKDRTGGLTSTVRGALVATYRGVFHSAASGHLPRISRVCCCGTTRSGLSSYPQFTHGSTSAVQPWASWQNPVGIPGGMPARRAYLPPHRLQTNGWDPAGILVPFRPQPGVSLPLNPGLMSRTPSGVL